jgi:hypothetical protein
MGMLLIISFGVGSFGARTSCYWERRLSVRSNDGRMTGCPHPITQGDDVPSDESFKNDHGLIETRNNPQIVDRSSLMIQTANRSLSSSQTQQGGEKWQECCSNVVSSSPSFSLRR